MDPQRGKLMCFEKNDKRERERNIEKTSIETSTFQQVEFPINK